MQFAIASSVPERIPISDAGQALFQASLMPLFKMFPRCSAVCYCKQRAGKDPDFQRRTSAIPGVINAFVQDVPEMQCSLLLQAACRIGSQFPTPDKCYHLSCYITPRSALPPLHETAIGRGATSHEQYGHRARLGKGSDVWQAFRSP